MTYVASLVHTLFGQCKAHFKQRKANPRCLGAARPYRQSSDPLHMIRGAKKAYTEKSGSKKTTNLNKLYDVNNLTLATYPLCMIIADLLVF